MRPTGPEDERTPRLAEPLTPRDHALGPQWAPIELVQYGDYQCPRCRDAHATIRALRLALGPDLRFAFRHFPLTDRHPESLLAAQAAEAAALQGRFWAMHDRLFERQEEIGAESLLWTSTSRPSPPPSRTAPASPRSGTTE